MTLMDGRAAVEDPLALIVFCHLVIQIELGVKDQIEINKNRTIIFKC